MVFHLNAAIYRPSLGVQRDTRDIIQAAGQVGGVVAAYLVGRVFIEQHVLAFLQCAQQGVAFGALAATNGAAASPRWRAVK